MSDTAIPSTGVRTIRFQHIKAGSLFKLIFLVVASALFPFILFCGVLALYGSETITVNGKYVKGNMGLVASLVMAPIFSLIVSILGWVITYTSLRVWGFFRPITLTYVTAKETKSTEPELE